jgi:CBS domain-containing protein
MDRPRHRSIATAPGSPEHGKADPTDLNANKESPMFFDTVSDLLRDKGTTQLHVVAPGATVAEAVTLMNRKAVGAVLVINGAGLEGMLSERDVMQKIVEPGLNPMRTPVREAMTPNPKTVRPNESAARALDLMVQGGVRHLPVTDGDRVHGVLSIRDLNDWLTRELRSQTDGALMAVKTMGMANRRR